jgi:uncharacterized protein with PQ loop repeat
MSVFTMVMTIPQVLTIWVGQQAAGVSLLSWSAYLASAILWFWFATKHFHETQHPVMRAVRPASWTWCYVHEVQDILS